MGRFGNRHRHRMPWRGKAPPKEAGPKATFPKDLRSFPLEKVRLDQKMNLGLTHLISQPLYHSLKTGDVIDLNPLLPFNAILHDAVGNPQVLLFANR